ncbi:MAG: transketolase [Candidatus Doudnabacteria bacterium RIFCSPLOWO2_02_FULL_48_13]|uniref:Transketolase n=1 Tax=Candidatus Doudnabacteria bacterium RIFCSPLOWO2_02_FULL_48_13 TaxID=1817845 RepID=A0A1F5QDY9_9BACT|nr:MAG: transketolase [Candidatus Doudnabacteria bacterium RIFCSPLOWO2_02_FULL_48_13]
MEQLPVRDGYGKGLVALGESDPNIVVLTGDLSESTRSNWFAEKFPKRFIEVGVAEQNMMGIAAGLALSGKIPFVSSYATFNPGRNWDQLRVSVCYSKANVKVAGAHAGISVGPDGATHQALEDIAITRVLPDLIVIVPCDAIEAQKATIAIGRYKGPAYIRFGREKSPVFTTEATAFKIGKAEVFREGADVAIIGSGMLVYNALQAAQELDKEGVSCEVINNHTIKPIDRKTIVAAAKKCGAVVTVEEHQINGGAGSAVIEVLAEECPVPVERVGMPDSYGESGQPWELVEKYGMGKDAIIKAIKKAISRKKSSRT